MVSALLVFLPWAIGGKDPWAQFTGLGLSALAFVIALLPRDYLDVAPGQAPFRLYTWPKLLRFPIFWLGLALLIYVTIQGLNPAWVFMMDEKKAWWMHKIPYREWLPSGVSVPFERGGPWRMLLVYAMIVLTSCAIWIGFTRRRSLQILFTVLVSNAFALAILGIAERATHATKIFWFVTPPASYFVASFTYKNHAGAYFNLVLALSAGLALWHYERGLRRLDKSSPSGLFAFFATSIVLTVIFSYSRTATLLMFAFLLVGAVVFFWRLKRQPGSDSRNPMATVIVLLTLGSFIFLGVRSLDTERLRASVEQLQQQVTSDGLGARKYLAQATWEMAGAQPVFGWGAGSFRFLFTLFQQHHPEIVSERTLHFYWEHAHNDYAEIFAELGLVGGVLIIGSGVYLSVRFLRAAGYRNPVSLFGALGCSMVLIHSYVDFHAYLTAIAVTWCAILVAIVRWAEIEETAPQG